MSRDISSREMGASAWRVYNIAHGSVTGDQEPVMEFFNRDVWTTLVEALESLEGEEYTVASLGAQLRSLYLSALGGSGDALPPTDKATEIAWQAVGVHLHGLLNGAAEEDRLERLESSFAEWAAKRAA